jgi:hypothetical protein
MDLQLLLNWTESSPSADESPIFSLLDVLGANPPASDTILSIPNALFTTIQKWISLHQEKPLRNALVVWTKWFSLPENLLPTQDILCNPEFGYFDVLQLALRDCIGHPALQKYALFVLRRSMMRVERDVRSESVGFMVQERERYLGEYGKYCSLFETIVIGRSVNQAEECLLQVPVFGESGELFSFSLFVSFLALQTCLFLLCEWVGVWIDCTVIEEVYGFRARMANLEGVIKVSQEFELHSTIEYATSNPALSHNIYKAVQNIEMSPELILDTRSKSDRADWNPREAKTAAIGSSNMVDHPLRSWLDTGE